MAAEIPPLATSQGLSGVPVAGPQDVAGISELRMDRPFNRFVRRHRGGLSEYAGILAGSESELTLAISRKGPRLLLLINQEPDLPAIPLDRCISEKALPFLRPEDIVGQRVLLTDDSVIFGSTYAGIEADLISMGANVERVVLALSKGAHESVASRVRAPIRIEPTAVSEFIDLEIQAFGSLGVPYDIDHPIFRISLGERVESFEGNLRARYPNVQNTTRRWQSAQGVSTLGLLIEKDLHTRHSLASRQCGPAKLRFFVDSRRAAVRVAAIFCLALVEEELTDSSLFARSPAPLGDLWRTLLDATRPSALPIHHRYRSLANAAHYLAGCEIALYWLRNNAELFAGGVAEVSEADVRLLFGPALATVLTKRMNERLRVLENEVAVDDNWKTDCEFRRFQPSAQVSAIARTKMGREFLRKTTDYFSLTSRSDPMEGIAAIFEAQRWVCDEMTRSQGPLDGRRLDVGLPYPVIRELLEVSGVHISDEEFAECVDKAVDGGTIVPRYGQALDDPTMWVRRARFGENLPRDAKVKYWLDYCLQKGIGAFRRTHGVSNPEALPWFLVEKMLVVLKAALGAGLDDELDLSMAVGCDEFGGRVVAQDIPGKPYLVDWAIQASVFADQGNVHFRRKSGPEVRGRGIFRNVKFSALYDPSRNALDRGLLDRSAMLIQAFMAIESSFLGDDRSSTILALTTCGSEDAYLSALSKELEIWLYRPDTNASRLVAWLMDLAFQDPERQRREAPRLAVDLSRSAHVLGETRIKRDAFDKRAHIVAMLDEKLREDGPMGVFNATWNNSLKSLVDIGLPRHANKERYLLFAAEMAKKAISIARTVLSENGLVRDARRPEARESLSHHVNRFNEHLDGARREGLTCAMPSAIDLGRLTTGGGKDRLSSAARIFEETRALVLETWTSWRHPAPTDVLQPYEHDVAVLLWDLVGSAGIQEKWPLGTAVDEINRRVKTEMLRFDAMGFQADQDDGNAILCKRVADAIELFRIISEICRDRGYNIKGAVESTVDGEKLWRNQRTGQFGGRAYDITARILAFFREGKDQLPPLKYFDPGGKGLPLEPPADSTYILIPERAIRVLQEIEGDSLHDSLELIGMAEGFKIRAVSVLSTRVSCYRLDGRRI